MRGLAIALALTGWTATSAAAQYSIAATAVVVEPLQAQQVEVKVDDGSMRVMHCGEAATDSRVLRETYVTHAAPLDSGSRLQVWTPVVDGVRLEVEEVTSAVASGLVPLLPVQIEAGAGTALPGRGLIVLTQVVAANS